MSFDVELRNPGTSFNVSLSGAPPAIPPKYIGSAGEAQKYVGIRPETELYVGAGNLWP